MMKARRTEKPVMLCNFKLFFIVNGPATVVNAYVVYICCPRYIYCIALNVQRFELHASLETIVMIDVYYQQHPPVYGRDLP